jgi:hypothetical protein
MSLKARLAQVEAALQVSQDAVSTVIYLDDYDIAPAPGDGAPGSVVYVPRKAASAEDWYEKVRKRFGYVMQHGPDSHGV